MSTARLTPPNEQLVWNELFERAKELAASCDIELSVPRESAVQLNCTQSHTSAVLVQRGGWS